MPEYWWCCQCKSGGYNVEIHSACNETSCQHKRCSACPTERHECLDSSSEFGDTHSECSDVAPDSLLVSKFDFRVPSPELPATPRMPLSILSQEGMKTLSYMPSGTSDHPALLTHAYAAALDQPSSHNVNTHGTNTRPNGHGERELRWYCCYCGDTDNSYRYQSHCPDCNHKRCRYCTVTEIIRK
ncbi:hypothetical protein BU26DRAFT_281967 [Trematosphaeria pertusa]|uniref:Uncharacterized protein n=1 Tax=Trematosphaeria pertusa TaxID=390896 RepID=A0A6A6IPF3_9PLEO|nr:uncharacterized protein BU26DRAFT_281967 [Trematosphaeria pertusa]KAF2251383.1 hypothetical protein BU26DRAFT_281967 [Trematosphaeria pertusa]